jgi:hypothetical protein
MHERARVDGLTCFLSSDHLWRSRRMLASVANHLVTACHTLWARLIRYRLLLFLLSFLQVCLSLGLSQRGAATFVTKLHA